MTTIALDRAQSACLATDIRALILAAAQRGSKTSKKAPVASAAPAKKTKATPAAVFKPGKPHKLSAAGHVEFMGIPETQLHSLFKDGRIIGLLMEHALAAQFSNISHVSDTGAPYDLFITDAQPGFQRHEHKVQTKANGARGADLAPSAQQGSKRHKQFVHKEFVARLMKQVDGVIVTDVRNFPEIVTRSFSKEDLSALGWPRYLSVDAVVPTAKKKAKAKK